MYRSGGSASLVELHRALGKQIHTPITHYHLELVADIPICDVLLSFTFKPARTEARCNISCGTAVAYAVFYHT